MSKIEFSKEEKAELIVKLQRYFNDELDFEMGQFEADFLLDFITRELGANFYNQGLADAQAVLEKRMETVMDGIYELEQPTGSSR